MRVLVNRLKNQGIILIRYKAEILLALFTILFQELQRVAFQLQEVAQIHIE